MNAVEEALCIIVERSVILGDEWFAWRAQEAKGLWEVVEHELLAAACFLRSDDFDDAGCRLGLDAARSVGEYVEGQCSRAAAIQAVANLLGSAQWEECRRAESGALFGAPGLE